MDKTLQLTEDILVPLKVKSNLNNYEITFHNTVEDLLNTLNKQNWFIIDKNLKKYYNFDSLSNKIFYECNETTKSFNHIEILLKTFTQNQFKSNTEVIIIGGGTLQDVAGFCCSIYSRGIKYKFVPTTLLSQCDSCVGGKTSINFNSVKNILGTFYPPTEILICDKFLQTLNEKDFRSGLGEVFKFKILQNKLSKDIFLKENLNQLIRECLEYKISIIEVDEFDQGLRKLLNYGHTFGHALEITSDYKIPHGSAVILGILIINDILKELNVETNLDYISINEIGLSLIEHITLNKKWFNIKNIIKIIKLDKKNAGKINLVIPDKDIIFKIINLEENEIIRLCNTVFKRFL
jgi:3-dehydroquinate synthase